MALLRSTRATAFRKAFKLTLAHSDNYNGTGCKFTVTLSLVSWFVVRRWMEGSLIYIYRRRHPHLRSIFQNSKKALRMMPILSRREMSVYQRFICGDRLVSEAVQTLFPAPHWVPAGSDLAYFPRVPACGSNTYSQRRSRLDSALLRSRPLSIENAAQ
jgi:hypothetical protein